MRQLHVFKNHKNEIMLKVITSTGAEADKIFKQTFSKRAFDCPGVTCMVEFVPDEITTVDK